MFKVEIQLDDMLLKSPLVCELSISASGELKFLKFYFFPLQCLIQKIKPHGYTIVLKYVYSDL